MIDGGVVGKIVDVCDHPNAQHLWLAQVDCGQTGTVQIVFGGRRNLEAGDLVPVAPPGSRCSVKGKMRRRRYRGEPSHGMLCSLDELGWIAAGPDVVAKLKNVLVGDSLDELSYEASIVAFPPADDIVAVTTTTTSRDDELAKILDGGSVAARDTNATVTIDATRSEGQATIFHRRTSVG